MKGRRFARGERGAALVEFAIILPIVVALALGIISGGNAYQKKLSMTSGAREGARYGATLPLENFSTLSEWLDEVASVAVDAVDDGLPSGTDGRVICVAYVYPAGTVSTDMTTRRYENNGSVAYNNSTCFTDGRPSTERRIQVKLARDSELNTGFLRFGLTLNGRGVARFEAIAG